MRHINTTKITIYLLDADLSAQATAVIVCICFGVTKCYDVLPGYDKVGAWRYDTNSARTGARRTCP